MQQYNIVIDKNKKETTIHGSFAFPLAIYTTQIRKNIVGFIDWHWHEELQFCIVTNGQVQFNIDGDSLVLTEGEGLFINQNQLHKAQNHLDSDASYICFDLHMRLLASYAGSVIDTKYVQGYTDNPAFRFYLFKQEVAWQREAISSLKEIYRIYNEQTYGFELQIVILFSSIWLSMIKNWFSKRSEEVIRSRDYVDFRTVMDYIHNHYMDKIDLSNLAKEASLSKSSLCRKFKRQMNATVFEYIINYRLSAAAHLLLNTDQTISTIAYNCGFGSTSYFIEKFKEKTNCTPLYYRKVNLP